MRNAQVQNDLSYLNVHFFQFITLPVFGTSSNEFWVSPSFFKWHNGPLWNVIIASVWLIQEDKSVFASKPNLSKNKGPPVYTSVGLCLVCCILLFSSQALFYYWRVRLGSQGKNEHIKRKKMRAEAMRRWGGGVAGYPSNAHFSFPPSPYFWRSLQVSETRTKVTNIYFQMLLQAEQH